MSSIPGKVCGMGIIKRVVSCAEGGSVPEEKKGTINQIYLPMFIEYKDLREVCMTFSLLFDTSI